MAAFVTGYVCLLKKYLTKLSILNISLIKMFAWFIERELVLRIKLMYMLKISLHFNAF